MCDDPVEFNKYICLYHAVTGADPDHIPLDIWLNDNVPEGYRIIEVMQDKMITEDITFIYNILLERLPDTTWTGGTR